MQVSSSPRNPVPPPRSVAPPAVASTKPSAPTASAKVTSTAPPRATTTPATPSTPATPATPATPTTTAPASSRAAGRVEVAAAPKSTNPATRADLAERRRLEPTPARQLAHGLESKPSSRAGEVASGIQAKVGQPLSYSVPGQGTAVEKWAAAPAGTPPPKLGQGSANCSEPFLMEAMGRGALDPAAVRSAYRAPDRTAAVEGLLTARGVTPYSPTGPQPKVGDLMYFNPNDKTSRDDKGRVIPELNSNIAHVGMVVGHQGGQPMVAQNWPKNALTDVRPGLPSRLEVVPLTEIQQAWRDAGFPDVKTSYGAPPW